MNNVLENIKQLFMQLFGFKEVEESKEWNEYLGTLGKNGYFTSKELEAFEESAQNMAEFEKRLESEGDKKKTTKGKLSVKDITVLEGVRVPTEEKGFDR